MEMWFSDEHTDNVKLSIRVDKQLFSAQSEFQRIDVLESKEVGKILVTDGDLMLTEKDEFIYHEMMAHVPMAVHPKVENVLVIGGGDGDGSASKSGECSGYRRRRRGMRERTCKV